MPKFIKRPEPLPSEPVFEAVQWTHQEPVLLKKGMWIISRGAGPTTYADDEWFKKNYQRIGDE